MGCERKDTDYELPTFIQAREDSNAAPYLKKGRINNRIKHLEITPEDKEKIVRIKYGRIPSHLMRMINPNRSEEEQRFAKVFIRLLPDYVHNDRGIIEVIAGEGVDTCLWWTFAPYLFKHLTENGTDEEESLDKILNWSKTGKSVSNSNADDWHYSNLEGLEDFNEHNPNHYVLSIDPNGVSHAFTDLKAKEIVVKHFLKVDDK